MLYPLAASLNEVLAGDRVHSVSLPFRLAGSQLHCINLHCKRESLSLEALSIATPAVLGFRVSQLFNDSRRFRYSAAGAPASPLFTANLEVLVMLGIGQKFPDFSLTGVVSNDIASAFKAFNLTSFPGKWKVIFFWPKDFTFVCPTEITGFAWLTKDFADRNAQVLGVSIDSEFVHLAWRKSHEHLNALPFPMLSDIKRELSMQLGILDAEAGVSQRAAYIVDPDNVIRFVYITDLNVGRSPEEVLRVLDALQTGELCACNWRKGDEPLKAA